MQKIIYLILIIVLIAISALLARNIRQESGLTISDFFRSSGLMSTPAFEPLQFEPIVERSEYSFFVAGHTYGNFNAKTFGFHPPFRDKILELQNSDSPVEFGVLTGDIVRRPAPFDWQKVRQDIMRLKIPVHIALGNHDRNAPKIRINQKHTYYYFTHAKDLFIILDPNLDGWNISGDQLNFLKQTLATNNDARHIFVFSHQLIWWDDDNEFRCANNNWVDTSEYIRPIRKQITNFETAILPIFQGLEQNIFFMAGDVGNYPAHKPMYFKNNNIHYISSGMGGGNGNFLVVNVGENVNIDLNWLFDVSTSRSLIQKEQVKNNQPNIEDYALNCAVD